MKLILVHVQCENLIGFIILLKKDDAIRTGCVLKFQGQLIKLCAICEQNSHKHVSHDMQLVKSLNVMTYFIKYNGCSLYLYLEVDLPEQSSHMMSVQTSQVVHAAASKQELVGPET